MIYFTSDLHFGHQNIIQLTQRPFNDIQEMNKKLIDNYNSVVEKDDTVYFLGDIAHELTLDKIYNLLSQLKGRKILIRGNHDLSYDYELTNCKQKIFDEINDFKMIQENNVIFVLSHYPMLSWFDSRKGTIMLHGHIHAKNNYNLANQKLGLRRFDVGVDANNYYPISLNRIIQDLKIMPEYKDFGEIPYYLDAITASHINF